MQKNAVDISFAQGLDQKTDPFRVQAGKFLSLKNSVFNKGGQLTKRNGYGLLAPLMTTTNSTPTNYLTTLNNNLTAVGANIQSYNTGDESWVLKGNTTPLSLSTLPLIRNNLNQTQCDAVIAPNGMICTAYSEVNNFVTTVKYAIADSITGQNIVEPTALPITTSGSSPRTFLLGNYFVIVFTNVVSSTSHLKWLAISIADPTVTHSGDIAAAYVSATTVAWDGVVVNNQLFVAYNTTSGGQAIKIAYLDAHLVLSAATTFANSVYKADSMSLCADTSDTNNPVIYTSFHNPDNNNTYTFAVNLNLQTIFSPVLVIGSTLAGNIATVATNGVCTIFIEQPNFYSLFMASPSIANNIIYKASIDVTGTPTIFVTYLTGIGLASKAFMVDDTIYFLAAYQSTFQDTYFLMDGTNGTQAAPIIAAKLAYENGGGYLTLGLPAAQVNGSVVTFPYLFKDLVQALTTDNNTKQTTSGGIYSQTGINLATIDFNSLTIDTSETAKNLHLSGGFLGMFDGYLPVEHNFFVWPDFIETFYSATSAQTPTGTFASGSFTVTLSSATGVHVGMSITDTSNSSYIPSGTFITNLVGTTATISKATTHSASGDNLSIQGNIAAQPDGATNTNAYYYQVTYEWSDNQGNIYRSAPSVPVPITTTSTGTTGIVFLKIPTLRLTMKTANPVKIVIYRWSIAQPEYHQITSIVSPVLNDTTQDVVDFVDVYSDASIQGNNIIYTTGGVVEDINAPATNIMTLFDTRLWLVDAEDPNLLWYSKQVIENTPVEMSDLFIVFIAPNTGTNSSTGPITGLSPMDDKLIIFKKDAIYYMNGNGPDNTGANSQYTQPIFITSTVGCSNQQSVVLTPMGLMFQSDKGIWLLDRGLNTTYIGAPVSGFNTSVVNSAVNVPGTNQIRFTVDTGEHLVYDYYYQQWSTFVGAPAVSSTIFQGLHTYINANGLAYQETPNKYLDGTEPVLLSFLTSWFNLAGLQGYERAYYFYILGTYLSPHKLSIGISYDYVNSPSQRVLLTPDNFSSSAASPFGDAPSPFGSPTNIEQWRVFLQRQKCQAFQLEFSELWDNTLSTTPGAGLTMSGLNLVLGGKKAYKPIKSSRSIG